MATEMWTLRYICHDRGRRNPEPEMIDRDYINFFDIKERMKELGFNQSDSVYYNRRGVKKGQFMIELTNDACVMKMLEEFSSTKEVDLHVFKTRNT